MKTTACYIRVSTADHQEKGLNSQRRALEQYAANHGLTNIRWFIDRASGGCMDRPAFDKLQAAIFQGRIHTVIVWRLDRLSRSLRDGINVLCSWLEQGVRIISVTQQLDFNGPTGQLIASVLFAVAAMERESLRENTRRGLAAAKQRGVKLGKRPRLFIEDIEPLLRQGLSVSQIAQRLGCTRPAVYNAAKRVGTTLQALRAS